jgi:glyoxylase-like metal-dependent hydrolase (beta-lactamase superfamily II)
MRTFWLASIALLVSACGQADSEPPAQRQADAAPAKVAISLTRLDCGSALIKDFAHFFSDRPGLYAKGPRRVTDSCYLIRHGDQQMIWDTGFSAALKGSSRDMGELVASLDKTLAEQLSELGLKPSDIDVVGISHMHADHTGQAAEFPQARLVIGKADFEQTSGKDDPFGPWRKPGAKTTLATGDVDLFGDGSVVAVHTPGHTPDHLALLVKLASGPVLLSGDVYHSQEAREKRGVPPFNTSREQTLKSMDRVEQIVRDEKAKLVIQHEPSDIGKLPPFPQAAQ